MGMYCIVDSISATPVVASNSHCSGNNCPDSVYLLVMLTVGRHDVSDAVLPYRNIHCFDSPLFDYSKRSVDSMDNFHRRDVCEHGRHVENLKRNI